MFNTREGTTREAEKWKDSWKKNSKMADVNPTLAN